MATREELCHVIGQRWEMQESTSLSKDQRAAVNQMKEILCNIPTK